MRTISMTPVAAAVLSLAYAADARADFGSDIYWIAVSVLLYPVLLVAIPLLARPGTRLFWWLAVLVIYPVQTYLSAFFGQFLASFFSSSANYYTDVAIGALLQYGIWLWVGIGLYKKRKNWRMESSNLSAPEEDSA